MQRRASVLIGVIALAIVAGASMLAQTPRQSSGALLPVSDEAAAAGRDEPLASRSGGEADSERGAGDVLSRSAATDARRVAEPSRPEDAPRRAAAEAVDAVVRLKLVDGLTGEELPGASVAWAAMSDVERRDARSPLGLQAAVEVMGHVEHADPDGIVTFRARPGNTVVAARSGELVAVSSLYDLRENTLALFRPRTLELRVADIDGLPCANAPVRIRASSDTLWLGRSDAAGSVRFDYADQLFRRQHEQRRAGVVDGLLAELMLGTVPHTQTSFVIEPWPVEPVRLTLPASGSVVVVVTNAAGGAPPDGALVRLTLEGTQALPYSQRLEAGRARIDSVQLGQTFRLEVDFEGQRASIQENIAGPTFAEPVVEVLLSCEKSNPILGGRLLDADGQPVRSAWFRVVAREASNAAPAAPAKPAERGRDDVLGQCFERTDTQGAFNVVLVGHYPAGRDCVVELIHPHAGDPQGRARFELSVDSVGEPVYVGDVRLERIDP